MMHHPFVYYFIRISNISNLLSNNIVRIYNGLRHFKTYYSTKQLQVCVIVAYSRGGGVEGAGSNSFNGDAKVKADSRKKSTVRSSLPRELAAGRSPAVCWVVGSIPPGGTIDLFLFSIIVKLKMW